MKQDRVLSLIGLATKAGKCASGEFMTENETKSGKAVLVIVAEDASDNTKKKFIDSNNSFLTGFSKSTISNSNNVEVVSSTSKIK